MKNLSLALLLVLATIVVACGPDKDQEQHDREKLAEDIAKMNEVAGTYRGYFYTANSEKPVGSVEIIMTAGTKQAENPKGTLLGAGPTQVATLYGTIRFQGQEQSSITFQDASYNSHNKNLVATFHVKMPGERLVQINFSAGLSGNTLEGTLVADGGTPTAGKVRVVRDAVLPTGEKWPLPKSVVFKGRKTYLGDDPKKDTPYLYINLTTSNIQQNMVNLLLVQPTVSLVLDLGEGARIPFPSVQWDRQTNDLTARLEAPQFEEKGYDLTCGGLRPMVCEFKGDRHGLFTTFEFDQQGALQ